MTAEKPLFIPLKRIWFDQFAKGAKTGNEEWRKYGPRWNEHVCRVGRRAVLSNGYGTGRRIERVITGTRKVLWADAPHEAKAIYPEATVLFAIKLDPVAS